MVLCSVNPMMEQRAERRFAQSECRANGEPFAEVVESNANRNHDGKDPAPPVLPPGHGPITEASCQWLRGVGKQQPRPGRTGRPPETNPAAAEAASRPSSAPSTSRNASSPTVKARRKSMARDDKRTRNGNHNSPIATGITPT